MAIMSVTVMSIRRLETQNTCQTRRADQQRLIMYNGILYFYTFILTTQKPKNLDFQIFHFLEIFINHFQTKKVTETNQFNVMGHLYRPS